MNFSHLIQINDPSDPSIEPLTREQLWQGLVARAENPSYFLIGVDECQISNRNPASMDRELRFGPLVIRDRVTLEPRVQVRYEVVASDTTPGGSLVMRIEEPRPGALFVRFDYQLFLADAAADDCYNEFRKSAYVESDIDTVRTIRQMAASGLLWPM